MRNKRTIFYRVYRGFRSVEEGLLSLAMRCNPSWLNKLRDSSLCNNGVLQQ